MSRSGSRPGVMLVHPGTQHSFRLARELASRDLLSGFWTGFALHRDGLLFSALKHFSRHTLSSRVLDDVPRRSLHTRPWIELLAQAALRAGNDPQRTMHRRNRRFQKAIPEAAFREAGSVLGFDTAAWILAHRAEKAGIPFLLDRSAPPPPARLFEVLARKFPAWRDDFDPRNPEVAEAERLEHEAASRITVASQFAKRRLVEEGVVGDKIGVIPYGVDSDRFAPDPGSARPERVRFLYAGAVSARKGVPVLLDAWRALDARSAQLTLVGQVRRDRIALLRNVAGITLKDRVSHAEMPAIYAAHDVFVFPSFHDGFGLVMLEAMAAGLPVIASSASAAPDLIADADNGFVVAPGDAETLGERMRYFIADPSRARRMGHAARETARQYSWESYGTAWARLLAGEGLA